MFRANVFTTSRRTCTAQARSNIMRAAMLGTILLVVLVLLLVGAIPSWPHSRSWGYGPSGLLGVVLVVVLILALTGRV
jgi:protein-S-isoprenylcysteine O-methyltransferase Ste14